ncbi:MAG: SCO family protein [Aureispira sp.]|nr:SCO family protein [Aureispira sp.]
MKAYIVLFSSLIIYLGFRYIQTASSSTEEYITLPFFNTADFTPEWLAPTDITYQKLHTIGQFEFTNQNGKAVNNQTFEGKIYVADFFFTICPGICPKLTKNMWKVQEAFQTDDDVLLLSHTVAPWMDSVAQLRNYATHQDVQDDKWHLVTGKKESIYRMARQSYFADKDIGMQQDSTSFLHTENLILIDYNGHIRGVYNGTLGVDVNRLIEDIHTLKLEKLEERV